MELLYNTSEMKAVGEVEVTRKVRFVISDDTKDRHGTVVNTNGWDLDHFNNNGIVGYQHDVYGGGMCRGADPDSVIGKGRAWIEDNVLMGEVEFEPAEINPLAEKVFRKVLHGTLKATSVGFRSIGGGILKNDETGEEKELDRAPYNIGEDETYYFKGQELLEFSIVNIPSNPNALKRELRNQTANALQFLRRELGESLSFGDIEDLKVIDVIRMLERPKDERDENKIKISIDEDVLKPLVDKAAAKVADGIKEHESEDSDGDAPLEGTNRDALAREREVELLVNTRIHS